MKIPKEESLTHHDVGIINNHLHTLETTINKLTEVSTKLSELKYNNLIGCLLTDDMYRLCELVDHIYKRYYDGR